MYSIPLCPPSRCSLCNLDGFKHQGFLGNSSATMHLFFIKQMSSSACGLSRWPHNSVAAAHSALRRPSLPGSTRWFWMAMISFCVLTGIASVGERDPLGVAHATLLTVEVLGLSMLAVHFHCAGPC